jgi:hypothetical protein
MASISVLFELPATASDFTSDVTIKHHQGKTTLLFTYYDEHEEKQYSLIIHDVYMSRFSTDACCTPFQIENGYEQIVALSNSDWVDSLYTLSKTNDIPVEQSLKHFLIYIPDFGCCEFLAAEVSESVQ